jgi:hypothetical protein
MVAPGGSRWRRRLDGPRRRPDPPSRGALHRRRRRAPRRSGRLLRLRHEEGRRDTSRASPDAAGALDRARTQRRGARPCARGARRPRPARARRERAPGSITARARRAGAGTGPGRDCRRPARAAAHRRVRGRTVSGRRDRPIRSHAGASRPGIALRRRSGREREPAGRR